MRKVMEEDPDNRTALNSTFIGGEFGQLAPDHRLTALIARIEWAELGLAEDLDRGYESLIHATLS